MNGSKLPVNRPVFMRNSSGSYIFVCCLPHAAVQDNDGSVLENALLLVDTLTSLTAKPSSGSNLLPAKIYYFPLKTKFLGRFYCNHFRTFIVLYSFIFIS